VKKKVLVQSFRARKSETISKTELLPRFGAEHPIKIKGTGQAFCLSVRRVKAWPVFQYTFFYLNQLNSQRHSV
jgi:hypothetical protein